ncbi:MAG: helix-turn-helix domain-containing protein [Anaerovoracaceae bacterium]|jgi:transcriptional regulator with XRE-family HTH domain
MDLNELIAENLQSLRTARNLSISQLAEKTGLSKAVLSQMERGNGNPTINTVWKIAEALHVPYSAILEPRRSEVEKVSKADLQPQSDDGGHYRISCYYPSTPDRDFEWFLLDFDPHTSHVTEGHVENSQEFVIVSRGKIRIEVNGRSFVLEEGDSLRFDATLRHVYRNEEEEGAQAYCINYYPRG